MIWQRKKLNPEITCETTFSANFHLGDKMKPPGFYLPKAGPQDALRAGYF